MTVLKLYLVALNISLYSFSSYYMYRAFIFLFVRSNFAQVDPTEGLIRILTGFIIYFYITSMVREIGSRQSLLKEFKVCLIFIPANLVNEAGLGRLTTRNCE